MGMGPKANDRHPYKRQKKDDGAGTGARRRRRHGGEETAQAWGQGRVKVGQRQRCEDAGLGLE